MQDWVILRHPGLLLMLGAALALCLMEKKWRGTRGLFFYASGALAIAAAALLILCGASLWEAAAWLTVFLLLLIREKE